MRETGIRYAVDGRVDREVIERAALLQRRAAAVLRSSGMRSEAARAEVFAARTRLLLDEPAATQRMWAAKQTLNESPDDGVLLERALEGALSLIGGDLGNIQIREPRTGGLRIAAQYGFGSEFLEYFALVEDDTSACGRAANEHSQTMIADVLNDAAFAPHRDIAAASGFRAVQSTPVIDDTGCLRGVISTHFRRAHLPSDRDLRLVQWYAEHVGNALARREGGFPTLYAANAMLHTRAADLQDSAAVHINRSAQVLLDGRRETQALAIRERARRAQDRARQARLRVKTLAGES